MKKLIIASMMALLLALSITTAAFAHTHVDTGNGCQDLANLQGKAHHGQNTAKAASPVVDGGVCP